MKRSFGIDILRAVSITMVVLRHYGYYANFNWGYFAVESLFVVSGYLIGQMLFNSYYETEVVQIGALKKFMIRRWMRVFPLYYFLLVVKFILVPSIGFNIIYYFLFVQNHFYGVSFFPVTWTLGIEEWFYLITPLVLYIFMKKISSKTKHVLYFLIGWIVLVNLERLAWVSYADRPFDGITGNVLLRQDSSLIGVLLAFIKYKYKDFFGKLNSWKVLSIGFLGLLGVVIALHHVRTSVAPDVFQHNFWARTTMYSTLALFTAMILPFMEQSIPTPKKGFMKVVGSVVKWVGKLSFAIYLTHVDVHLYCHRFLIPYMSDSIINLIGIAITVLISYVLHMTVEKKVLEMRDRRHPDNWQSKI